MTVMLILCVKNVIGPDVFYSIKIIAHNFEFVNYQN